MNGKDWPDAQQLREAFLALDGVGFPTTSRLPLFAARHWSLAQERRAYDRFRRRLCNIEEVAVPRWYRAGGFSPELRALFSFLTLGLPADRTELPVSCALVDAGGCPRWRVVARFSRYILHSMPGAPEDSVVYFGDDTLFLMQQARRLLGELEGPKRVLDLCCGGGGVGLALPAFEGELLGVDIHAPAVQLAALAAAAQKLENYGYQCADAASILRQSFDLVVGNPPTLPPELGGRATLYATGSAANLLELIELVVGALMPRGRALLTVFSIAVGRGELAEDPLRRELARMLRGRRGHAYSVRRQYPLGQGRWLRHVALELFAADKPREESFRDLTVGGMSLAGLSWRRRP
jgi:SAM-dependent methyltransferase